MTNKIEKVKKLKMIFLNFDSTSLPGFILLINVVEHFAVELCSRKK